MKMMMVLMAAGAGAAGTLFWLRGGDLGQLKDKAKRAMGQAEREVSDVIGEMSSVPAYVPAPAVP